MHPVIKIVNLVIVSIFLTQGNWFTLLLTGALLLPFYIVRLNLWAPALKMLFRLKWFFISILLIYYFYIPDLQTSNLTSISGISIQMLPGFFRIAVLVIILFSVNLFIKTTSKEEILSALLWLFIPLKIFKIDSERISLRAILTLEYIEVLSQHLNEYKEKKSLNITNDLNIPYFTKVKSRFLHLIDYSSNLFYEVLEDAESTSGKSYSFERVEPPLLFQYSCPLILCILLSLSLSL